MIYKKIRKVSKLTYIKNFEFHLSISIEFVSLHRFIHHSKFYAKISFTTSFLKYNSNFHTL